MAGPEWLKSKKSGTAGFPSLTRRKTLFLFRMKLCTIPHVAAACFLASAVVITGRNTPDQPIAESAEEKHQQQEKEQKAVIDAFRTSTEHMVIPPCQFESG
jgi:hypothetical protein